MQAEFSWNFPVILGVLEPLAAGSNPAENQPQAALVTVHISAESDFAADLYQVIPSELCYSPPLWPTAMGGMEMWYDGAITITNFKDMYYFESGLL